MSKYDGYWFAMLEDIKSKISEAIQRGFSGEIDVSSLKDLGKRKSWSTRVEIRPGVKKISEELSPDAHGKSLGNVIIKSGILNNIKETIIARIASKKGSLYLSFEKS